MDQPKTGVKCSCRPGTQRDNCQRCEGTGLVIDFKKIREKPLESCNTLKEQIIKAFPNAEFGRHETDLYVKVLPGLIEWLKVNYEHFTNIQRFTSQIDKTQWLDIPFAAWNEKYKR